MNTHKTLIRKTLKRKSQSPSSPSPALSPSEFNFTLTRTAISQICQHIGFKSSNSTALQTLTRIATIYLQSLANIAADHAANSNRTECNLFDVVISLEDLASVLGFRGAASRNYKTCMLNSSILTDIMNYVDYTDELPFAKPIPRVEPPLSSYRQKPNLIRKKRGAGIGGGAIGRSLEYMTHIPPWLPPFPEQKTYENQLQRRVLDSFKIDRKLLELVKCNAESELKTDETNHTKESKSVETKRKSDMMMRLPEKRVKVRFKINFKSNARVKNNLKDFPIH